MVEFELKVHPEQHSTYLPRQVVKALGNKLTLFANSKAAIIYSEGTNLKDVLTSVEILTADLKHRIEMNQQETQKPILKKGKVEAVRVSQAQTTPTQEPPIAEAPT